MVEEKKPKRRTKAVIIAELPEEIRKKLGESSLKKMTVAKLEELLKAPPEPEEPVVTEEQPEEPEPERTSPKLTFDPEPPVKTDTPVVINGRIEGYETIKGKGYWMQVVRQVEESGIEFIRNVPCTFEGERTVAVG